MVGRVSRLVAGRRSRWVVIAIWAVLAAALAPLQPRLLDEAADESETFLVEGSESAEVDRVLDERFPVGREVVTAIVYVRTEAADDGFLAEQDERITDDAVAICGSGIPTLRAVFAATGIPACDHRDISLDIGPETPPSPVSDDQQVAITSVLTDDDDTEAVVRDVAAIREIVERSDAPDDGVAVHVSGPGGIDADRAEAVAGIDRTLLAITAVLIAVILLAVYRSPLVAAVPLAVVAAAYLVAAGLTWALVSVGATTISGQTTAILIVLMFGAGTDYCLLILARFRDELRAGADPAAAMAAAAERTGTAILSAGAIVAGVMLLLGLADFNATREMGPILALGMVVMVIAGLTLLPAMLAAVGRAVFWPGARPEPAAAEARGSAETAALRNDGVWARAARLVERRPAPVAIAVTAVLALGALGNLGGRETLDFTEAFRDDPDSVEGVAAIREHFAPGRAAPLDIVVTEHLSGDVIVALDTLPEVAEVIWSGAALPPEEPQAPEEVDPAQTSSAVVLASHPSGSQGPSLATEPLVKADLILALDPFSQQAADFVPRLREQIHRNLDEALALREDTTTGIAILGGPAAEIHDAEQAIERDTWIIVPLALLLVFAVLVALLRAILAPLYLIATVVLSFLFALGVGSLFFTHVMGQPGSDPSLTIFAFIFLVGLGVDYNIFLVGRIQEERSRGLATRPAVLAGLARTGGVITSAGLILAGTFSALMALTFEALFQFGFVIALGLLVDTFLVRALLVPSVAYLLGDRNWWPWGSGAA
ncbi:MAG TPA: MMPL family transporter [Solirubrobacterales bacterium]|nr:MMPL family transporter [Solirubrobacterales bacterium]